MVYLLKNLFYTYLSIQKLFLVFHFSIIHTVAVKTDMIELITNFKRRVTAWSLAWAVRNIV